MNDAAARGQDEHHAGSSEELDVLRSLLVSPEQTEIASLKERLDNPEIRAEDLARVLAEAVVIRASRDKNLAQALLPTIEQVIKDSVRKDPKFLADAIFPIIGPAIRKAVAESIRSMVQSINESLQWAFSWQSIKWRIEALQTGKSFAEIVLLHTLIYRVEQIFLIHGETGILLDHVAIASEGIKDVDMVSGMLTAIQDFVHDSFGAEENHSLNSMHVGEFMVWVEHGSQLALAAVIRGNPPEELRRNLQEALEAIEFEQGQILQSFDGEVTPFEKSRYHLEACLFEATGWKKGPHVVDAAAASTSSGQAKKRDWIFSTWFILGVGFLCLIVVIAGIILSGL